VHIPMGIDLARFRMTEPDRATYKARLGVPGDKVCIGYFQRDGDEEPKLVKGPDVFIDVIGDLWIKHRDLFVLLAGPKRGYVMRNLDRLGVPYKYLGWVPFTEMAACYYASDLYLITSREEGGPAAVLECMATGTPLVSTRVGMAVDVIRHGWNGFLADIEDRDALVNHTSSLLDDPGLRTRLSAHALQTAVDYDWSRVAADYSRLLYAGVGQRQESGHNHRDNLHSD